MKGWALVATLALAACAQPQAAQPIRVAKALGSKQCEGGGRTLAELRAELERAGVGVLRAALGTDGRMRVQMCGAPDGRLGIFEIPAAARDAAAAAGFGPLPEGARETGG